MVDGLKEVRISSFNICLDVPIDEPIELEVIIILTEWVDQRLGYFEPSNVKDELA
jgi:hypothetical protein